MTEKDEAILYCFVPQVDSATNMTPADMIKELKASMGGWIAEITNEINSDISTSEIRGDSHLALRQMLLSKQLYVGNLCEMEQLEQVMEQVARIDRLPETNTIEATRTLCQAWDSVDLFTQYAWSYKILAKTSYALMLLIGAAASIITVVSINRPLVIKEGLRASIVIGLSVAGTAVVAVTKFLDPVQRWTQLQSAALALESECWKFRTRSGVYQLASAKETASGPSRIFCVLNLAPLRCPLPHSHRNTTTADRTSASHCCFNTRHAVAGISETASLRQVLETVRQHTSKSASLAETKFSSTRELFHRPKGKLSMYRHGQYLGCKNGGTFGHAAQVAADMKHEHDPIFDDHHSPLTPEKYLRLRVEPMVRFYQNRMPTYFNARAVFEVIVLAGALSGTVMTWV